MIFKFLIRFNLLMLSRLTTWNYCCNGIFPNGVVNALLEISYFNNQHVAKASQLLCLMGVIRLTLKYVAFPNPSSQGYLETHIYIPKTKGKVIQSASYNRYRLALQSVTWGGLRGFCPCMFEKLHKINLFCTCSLLDNFNHLALTSKTVSSSAENYLGHACDIS